MGLKIQNVSKTFGKKLAVDNISFEIDKPGVFGLLGTNGAGKSTTIRMILGILKKDEGSISWNGKEVERKYVNFGYLPEERGIYPKIKICDQLIYLAKLKGMKEKEAKESMDYWLRKLEVEEYKYMIAEKLSKGNQQKIQFITSVIHNPELLVIDEPFSGLDPVNTELLKNAIIELVSKGTYIIMSSHQMASIEEFCQDILILNRGKTVLKGNLKSIKEGYKANRVELITKKDVSNYINKNGLKILKQMDNQYEIEIREEKEAQKLLKNIIENKEKIEKIEVKKPSLNDIFIEKVGDK